jgi:hypothetical protein
VLAAPLIAISVVVISALNGTDRLADAPLRALLWMGLTLALGYFCVIPLLGIARVLGIRPGTSLEHTA